MCLQDKTNALHFAVHHGCTEATRLLIEAGADLNAKDNVSNGMGFGGEKELWSV